MWGNFFQFRKFRTKSNAFTRIFAFKWGLITVNQFNLAAIKFSALTVQDTINTGVLILSSI